VFKKNTFVHQKKYKTNENQNFKSLGLMTVLCSRISNYHWVLFDERINKAAVMEMPKPLLVFFI
jgi:hypothetical protein